jgi:uncharacterized protein YegL
MSQKLTLSELDLFNSSKRVPVGIIIDDSYSMNGEPIKQLNKGVKSLYKTIKDDETACQSAEILLYSINKGIMNSFNTIENLENPPEFIANSTTPLAEAIIDVVKILGDKKEEYKINGIDYYQPIIIIMTDGKPTDDNNTIIKAKEIINYLNINKKLSVKCIAIGSDVDELFLKSLLSENENIIKFTEKNNELESCFEFISKTVIEISNNKQEKKSLNNKKTENIEKLNIEELEKWAIE